MIKREFTGTLNGIIASISYGTNPLFALPLYAEGFSANSVLFYRYFFAALIYGLWIKFVKKTSIRVSLKEGIFLFILGIAFSVSSLTLFKSFEYIDSGIACTLLFVYPVFTALIMATFFKEKISIKTLFAILLAFLGIFLLYGNNSASTISPFGSALVLASAMLYAFYIVGVKKIPAIKHIKTDKLNFYVMLFGLSVYIFNLKFGSNLEFISTPKELFFTLALAVFPTIISIETITVAIKLIGSTKTATLGALEPLTALICGTIFFKEQLTFKAIIGVIMILTGISIAVAQKR